MADDVKERFAANLKRLREERGWSQAQLAREARVTAWTVSGLEAGKNGPSLHVADALSTALGTTVTFMCLDYPAHVPGPAALRADTDQALARGREILARWDASPRLAVARVTAQALADMLNAEFPGRHPGRVLASAVTGLASAGAVMTEHSGSEPGAVLMLALATVTAHLAEEEAGNGWAATERLAPDGGGDRA